MGVQVEMTADNAKLLRGIAQLEKKVESLQIKLAKVGKAGRRSGEEIGRGFEKAGRKGKDAFDPARLAKFAGGLIGAGSVAAAIGIVNRGWTTWLKNMRDISKESRKAQDDVLAFAILQEGGTKGAAIQELLVTAQSFGVRDRGSAAFAAQALQSQRGSLEEGLKAARAVFAGTQVGIDIEQGKELEIFGASLGQEAGQTIRRAFVAGLASGRGPKEIATAGPSLSFFKDQDFAFGVAGTLAGTVGAEQLRIAVQNVGIALSFTSALGETFKKLGVGQGATKFERLKALRDAGLDTPEKLKEAGLGEVKRQKSIADLIRLFPEVVAITERVRTEAKPGVLPLARLALEKEIPSFKTRRDVDIVSAIAADEKAFGPVAERADKLELEQRIRGIAFRRKGLVQTPFGQELIDEEGRSTIGDLIQYVFFSGNLGRVTVQDINQEMDRVREQIRQMGDEALSTAEKLKRVGEALGGGPGLKAPGVDK